MKGHVWTLALEGCFWNMGCQTQLLIASLLSLGRIMWLSPSLPQNKGRKGLCYSPVSTAQGFEKKQTSLRVLWNRKKKPSARNRIVLDDNFLMYQQVSGNLLPSAFPWCHGQHSVGGRAFLTVWALKELRGTGWWSPQGSLAQDSPGHSQKSSALFSCGTASSWSSPGVWMPLGRKMWHADPLMVTAL